MAERIKSKDGRKETEEVLGVSDAGDLEGAFKGASGRKGGNLARKVGTRDEEKRAKEQPTTTRVRKSDEIATGNDREDS